METQCGKYRELLEAKRALKRMLKQFDEDFLSKKGRNPKKADKEILRPQYQQYHEVRGELERLKESISLAVGGLSVPCFVLFLL